MTNENGRCGHNWATVEEAATGRYRNWIWEQMRNQISYVSVKKTYLNSQASLGSKNLRQQLRRKKTKSYKTDSQSLFWEVGHELQKIRNVSKFALFLFFALLYFFSLNLVTSESLKCWIIRRVSVFLQSATKLQVGCKHKQTFALE